MVSPNEEGAAFEITTISLCRYSIRVYKIFLNLLKKGIFIKLYYEDCSAGIEESPGGK